MEHNGPTRFKVSDGHDFAAYRTAATEYVGQLTALQRRNLHEKPLDWGRGHITYVLGMGQVLNALRTLDLPVRSTIVEVGSRRTIWSSHASRPDNLSPTWNQRRSQRL